MEAFVAVLHIIVALVLISLVLVQDTKSGSLGGAFGGGGSNSVFGATGATTLAQKLTRGMALVFAITCITLSIFSARSHKSVIDSMSTPATSPAVPATAPTTPPAAPAPSTPDNK